MAYLQATKELAEQAPAEAPTKELMKRWAEELQKYLEQLPSSD